MGRASGRHVSVDVIKKDKLDVPVATYRKEGDEVESKKVVDAVYAS